MATEETVSAGESKTVTANSIIVKVEAGDSALKSAGRRLLVTVLVASIMMNLMFLISTMFSAVSGSGGDSVPTSHHSGDKGSKAKLAVINFSGMIMPPYTERWLKQIQAAAEDDNIQGVLLAVDSPGGLVADSHQIYRELQKLRTKKPIYVAMKRLAASGGYYISMGIGPEGKIFAEPTTWTGSIGVIIPRYNATELASKIGVTVEPLVTGPLKDTLNPFRDMRDSEKLVWDAILKDSFDRFVGVIQENRAGLDDEQVRALATGQIYTTNQAIENGLVDEIGYEEDALDALAAVLQLDSYEAVQYATEQTLMDLLLGGKSATPRNMLEEFLDTTTPKALYYSSWNPWVPTTSR